MCVFRCKTLNVTGEGVLICDPKSPCIFQSCSATLETQHFYCDQLCQESFKFTQVDFNCMMIMMEGRGYDTECRKNALKDHSVKYIVSQKRCVSLQWKPFLGHNSIEREIVMFSI